MFLALLLDLFTTYSLFWFLFFFFFNDTATTEIYTLSLHDALPISTGGSRHAGSAWTPLRSRSLRLRGRPPRRALHRVSGGDAALGPRRPTAVHGGASPRVLPSRGGVDGCRAGGRSARAPLRGRARGHRRRLGSARLRDRRRG